MQSAAYKIRVPRWDGSGAYASQSVRTDYDKGYGVNAPKQKFKDKHHDARNNLYHLANGQLNNGSVQWPLFITSVDVDFSVQGSIGQSRLTRDFYPHNFVQPTFQISGQAIDEMDYGQMCDFVHMCQYNLVESFSPDSLMQLQVATRGIPGHRTTGLTVSCNNTTLYNQSVHGLHSEIIAKGVVTSMPRQHRMGVPAPTWSFGFQVYQMISGPFIEGQPQSPPTGHTWVNLLKGAANLPTKPMLQQNSKVLKYAGQNAVNVISSTAGGG